MPLTSLPDDDPELNPEQRASAARRSTWVSVVVNVLLSALQVVAGLAANSQALVADALHSLSDLLSDFVVLIANRTSSKAPDADHHYGHHRYQNAAAFIVGLLMLAVAVGMLWAGVHKLENPDLIAPVQTLALWAALGALITKELLFRYLLHVAEKVRSSLLVANAWHARSDAASSLVVLAGIGGSLFGYPILDPIAALIVGLVIFRMGFRFTWNALHDLMDRAADEADNQRIEELIRTTPGVTGFHDLRTRRVGDMILVDVHIEVDGNLNVRAGHDIALEARRRVMEALPVLNLMTHVDPTPEN